MQHTLELFLDGKLVFHSNGKWLHPLFELEHFLQNQNFDRSCLIVKDKIVGRAAALLQLYLGIKHVKVSMMSELGKNVFDTHGIKYEYEQLVDRIQCRTEEMLKDEHDPEKAYEMIKALAGK